MDKENVEMMDRVKDTALSQEDRNPGGSKKLFFIFNPKAGTGIIRPHLADIIDLFNQNGFEVIARATQGARDAYEMVKAYAGKVDLIVCSGGDGTMDEAVTGLVETGLDTPLGYIPGGSTNDFANSLFMPKTPLGVAKNIMAGNIYQCDVGKFNQQTFIYVAAFGLFTDVSYQTPQDQKNVLGHMAYVLNGVGKLFDIKSFRMKVSVSDYSIERDFIVGMITNSRSIGGFKNLVRDVDMDDGLFEVTLIEMPKNPYELQQIIGALMMEDDDLELIHSFKAREITFESEQPVAWTLDGEFGGEHKRVEIVDKQKALRLCLTSTKEEQG